MRPSVIRRCGRLRSDRPRCPSAATADRRAATAMPELDAELARLAQRGDALRARGGRARTPRAARLAESRSAASSRPRAASSGAPSARRAAACARAAAFASAGRAAARAGADRRARTTRWRASSVTCTCEMRRSRGCANCPRAQLLALHVVDRVLAAEHEQEEELGEAAARPTTWPRAELASSAAGPGSAAPCGSRTPGTSASVAPPRSPRASRSGTPARRSAGGSANSSSPRWSTFSNCDADLREARDQLEAEARPLPAAAATGTSRVAPSGSLAGSSQRGSAGSIAQAGSSQGMSA